MKVTFTAIVQKDEVKSATGFACRRRLITALGEAYPVVVSVGRHTYRSTVSASGDVFMLPLSAEHREAAGLKAGDVVALTLELDEAPRTVTIPRGFRCRAGRGARGNGYFLTHWPTRHARNMSAKWNLPKPPATGGITISLPKW